MKEVMNHNQGNVIIPVDKILKFLNEHPKLKGCIYMGGGVGLFWTGAEIIFGKKST